MITLRILLAPVRRVAVGDCSGLLAIRPDVGAPTLDGARFSVPDIDLGLRP